MNEGRVIQGRYRLLAKLGQGGMGSVWRATHIELGTPVAVKLIDPTVADSKVALARFKREAQAAASLRGTNVVQVLDYGIDDTVPYIVMELLEGENLGARLSHKAPLSPTEAAHILGQVGKALARAHALNIVHRDLKPDNIFIVRDGDDEVTKVLDFGIAKTMSPETFEASIQTKSGAILGTPHYMSPEQAAGRSTVDHRTDVWSFGVIAFECLTGCRPFNGSTLGGLVIAICTEAIPQPSQVAMVPRGFDDWFARCVCREQSGRFQSILDAVVTLRAICEPRRSSSLVDAQEEPQWEQGSREVTLQNNSVRSASQPNPGAGVSGSATGGTSRVDGGTVSTSSRTVGSAQKRRISIVYMGLAVLLLGVGAVGAVGYVRKSHSLAAASAAPSTTAALVASASDPAALAREVPSAQPSLAITQPITIEGEAPKSLPVVSAVASQAHAESGAPRHAEPAHAPTTAVVPVQTLTPTVPPTEAVPAMTEPATRPEPERVEAPSPPRRRSIEDRLAF